MKSVQLWFLTVSDVLNSSCACWVTVCEVFLLHAVSSVHTSMRPCCRMWSCIVLLDYCSLLLRRRTSTKSTLNMHWDTSDTMSTPEHHDKLTLSCSKMFSMCNPPWYYDRAKPFRCWCCDILWYFFACRDLRWQCSFARIWLMLLVLWPAPKRNEDAVCFRYHWRTNMNHA